MAKENKIKIKDEHRVTIDDVIKDDNPLIREISFDVPYPLTKEDALIMNQMIDYVRSSINPDEAEARNLRPAYGISAIQLGYPKKMMFIRIESDYDEKVEEFALVNPKITFTSENKSYLKDGEGCLSVENDHNGYVMRPYKVKIVAIDYFTDREIEIEAKGLTSIVLQHEMDHLKGVLFYDRINKLNPFNVDKKAIKI